MTSSVNAVIKEKTKLVVISVFWPAAAGNVFWSFFTLLVTALENGSITDVDKGTLLALLLIAGYLSANWVRIYHLIEKEISWSYLIFDLFHIWTIVFFAIAAQFYERSLENALLWIFGITIVGHLCGAWSLGKSSWKKDWKKRVPMACVSGVGPIVIFWNKYYGTFDPWVLPASIVFVLFFWVIARWNELTGRSQ